MVYWDGTLYRFWALLFVSVVPGKSFTNFYRDVSLDVCMKVLIKTRMGFQFRIVKYYTFWHM